MPTLPLTELEHDELSLAKTEASMCLPVPGYDAGTRRVETGAFFLLGLIGITLIVLAGGNAIEFSENRETIAAALASPPAKATMGAETAKTKPALTNVTAIPTSAERMPIGSGKNSSHAS